MRFDVTCVACGNVFTETKGPDIPLHPLHELSPSVVTCPKCGVETPTPSTVLNDEQSFNYAPVPGACGHQLFDIAVQSDCLKRVCETFKQRSLETQCLAYLPDWIIQRSTKHLAEVDPDDVAKPAQSSILRAPEGHKRVWIYTYAQRAYEAFDGKHTIGSKSAIQALLSAIITCTWTNFEVLAEDLWIAAVDGFPKCALLRGHERRIDDLSSGHPQRNDSKRDDQEKLISLSKIAKHTKGTFDLSGKMGTMLSDSGRVRFRSLDDIRRAYSMAFAPKWADTNDIDSSLASGALLGLSLVRNLIVHRCGIADEEFIKRSAPIVEMPQIPIGRKLDVDGMLTCVLVLGGIKSAIKLIHGVDTWLVDARGETSD